MKKKINISIIAHIDHGKSTFCDALIKSCYGNVFKDNKTPSLDSHEIEKQRGVTIRNHFIQLINNDTEINIIDTPGHCDFVQYALVGIKASDLSLLLIDITQGVQAQTIFLLNEIQNLNKKCIVVLNKIDCNVTCDVDKAIEIIKNKITPIAIQYVSAKNHINIDACINNISEHAYESIITSSNDDYSFLVLDCIGSKYYGTTLFIKILYGEIKIGQTIEIKKQKVKIRKIQIKSITIKDANKGEHNSFYYIQVNEKIQYNGSLIGVSISNNKKYNDKTIVSGIKPVLYCDVASKKHDHEQTLKTLSGLIMSDHSVELTGYNSKIYGRVYRCGFLGTLHQEVFFAKAYIENPNLKIEILHTNPQYVDKNEQPVIIHNINQINKNFKSYLNTLKSIYVEMSIQIVYEYYSHLLNFIKNHTHTLKITKEIKSHESIILLCTMSSQELSKKLIDTMKGCTKGYASLMIKNKYYRNSNLSVIEILINKTKIDELMIICESKLSEYFKNSLLETMSNKIKRFQYALNIQIMVDKKIVKSHTVKPHIKDVTAKCYGGDVTRKNKLLQKQQSSKNKLMNAEKGSLHSRIISMIYEN